MSKIDDLNRQNEVKNSKFCLDKSNLTAMRLLISSPSQPSFPLINFLRYSALLELQPFKPFFFSFQDCAFKKLKSDTALKVSRNREGSW